ncbi:hypothetical protein POM88_014525 [Heracleum sosnowskyi]|uniref:Cytochrome P450 n=1 Tax=Heracleum sosnowskyi TaxID=360622 RepID=A0AAD8J0J9_9APIA|nr:hypothetical protein POM88_014525 [Heracleum sosnowskyi]
MLIYEITPELFNGRQNAPTWQPDVHGLSYLKPVNEETLRLHTPVPRECRKQCEIHGYTILVGTKVMANAWAMGRDPETWEPFGAGRRICAGIGFAVATLELPMAQLLYYFDWKLPNDMKLKDLDVEERNGAIATRQNSLILIPTLHTPNLFE